MENKKKKDYVVPAVKMVPVRMERGFDFSNQPGSNDWQQMGNLQIQEMEEQSTSGWFN